MSADTINVIINGVANKLAAGSTIGTYLESCGWKPTQVVVEHNSNVIARTDVNKIKLSDGDRLEVVIPVAGG
jgi:thiamine biosynthesis protein ThiS